MNLLQILRSSINAIYAKYLKNEDIDNLPIYYIGGSQTLPPPLSPEEEEETLQKIAAGQEELRQVLVERNLRLVVYIAKKFENTGVGIEDLISIGTIGLMKAVVTFDPEKSARLATYAARCIENELLMHFRGKKKSSKEVSLYEPIGTDREGNEIQLFDVIEMGEEDVHHRLEKKEDVIRLYQKVESELSARERIVLKLRYGLYNEEEYTQREIAKMLGISRSYVSRIEKSAIEKLRAFFPS